jgi:peptide/nickel transport system substrate-binding protein
MKQRMRLWDQWKQASDPTTADKLFRQILDLAADGFEVVGTVQAVTTFGVTSKKLTNVPDKIPFSWDYATPGPTQLQQYYFAP